MAFRGKVVHRTIRSAKRATDWIQSSVETAVSSIAAATAILDQSFNISEPSTVVRTRGSLWIQSDQIAASEQPFGALGMAVVTDQASAIGISAIPSPYTNAGSDSFFVHLPFAVATRFGDATGFSAQSFTEFKFDSKAMRKVADSDSIVVVLENGSAAHGLNFLISFRMLIKLHG